ncbi:MAG: amino acid adenylation domain-containing protein [Acidimicrobiia bacterium]|nr:amino acid adenylation domain-containing protein [Acidimicrobiia bacterium]MDH5237849.1 amino acid adenylation domain-containing protein [Acidimicrobiia bacterium]
MTATLADLVAEQARRRPTAPAVAAAGRELTWADLDEQTALLAGSLQQMGVERGDRVGIWMHKSLRTPVAVHGVLRAGGAYVPLDPLTPPAAVARTIEDCGLDIVVSETPAADRLPQLFAAAPRLRSAVGVVDDTVPGVRWEDLGAVGAPVALTRDDLAYVMYTSGSTGEPKGIMHTHGSAMAYASRAAATYSLEPDDRLGLLTPIHFDMSTFELFAGPLAGACTVVVPEPYLRVPASLAQLIAKEQITTLYGVPFLFTQLLDRGALDQHDLGRVRWLLYGGEPFAARRLAEWMRRLPNCRVSNVYGPAEVNQCTFHHLDEPPPLDVVIPIGECWDGADGRVVVDGRDARRGDPGELWIASPTMMAGYWARPDRTAESVVQDREGRRWYRTGDLVVEVDPGRYQFVARMDDQVKVRGHRLELSPVELALGAIDGVRHAVAGVIEGDGRASELVAVYVGSSSTEDILRQLAEQLPPYAVPSRLAAVDDLPTGPTGKIDRRHVRRHVLPELFPTEVRVP